MNQWQDIATAPKVATAESPYFILGTDGTTQRVIWWYADYPYNQGEWVYGEYADCGCCYSDFLTYDPTHWMPLPLLPNKEKG